jgi:hypothetical protein
LYEREEAVKSFGIATLRSLSSDSAECCAVVPVVLTEADPDAKLQSLKKSQGRRVKEKSKTFDGTWKLKPYDLDEWKSWLFLQQVERDVKAESFYILVRLLDLSWDRS